MSFPIQPLPTRILLTGSSGWLGRFLAPQLQAAGCEVVGLDVATGECTTVVGSVFDRSMIDRVFSSHGIEAVVHCGALHKPDIVRYPAATFVDVNVSGTLNLLEAAVAAGHDRFVFTSTTSLMVSNEVRAGKAGGATSAFWMDEDFGPLRPRNIYGATKLAAENLCHLYSDLHGLGIAILRTGRFFPEDDDTLTFPSGPNLKANEFLNRRLSVADAAMAHVEALRRIAGQGCRTYVLSAPTPFCERDCTELVDDAPAVISRYFPEAKHRYESMGWLLPESIERVYVARRAEEELGFRPAVDFSTILTAIKDGLDLPFQHDPNYVSPKEPG